MALKPDIPNAPGCFGSALCFRVESPECQVCAFAQQCAPVSIENLELLRDQFGITIKQKRKPRRPAQVTDDGLKLIGELPVKVQEILERCDRLGIRITESLRERRNPFPARPLHLRLLCHLLLKLPDGIDQRVLESLYRKKLGCTEITSESYASQAVKTLMAVGAVEQNGSRVFLKATL